MDGLFLFYVLAVLTAVMLSNVFEDSEVNSTPHVNN